LATLVIITYLLIHVRIMDAGHPLAVALAKQISKKPSNAKMLSTNTNFPNFSTETSICPKPEITPQTDLTKTEDHQSLTLKKSFKKSLQFRS
jgi:hypothetical protein